MSWKDRSKVVSVPESSGWKSRSTKVELKEPEPSFAEKATGVAKDVGREVGAFFEGDGIGEYVPVIGGLGKSAGQHFRAGVDTALKAGGDLIGVETPFKGGYAENLERIQNESADRKAKFEREHPFADLVQKLVGGVAGAAMLPVPGAKMEGALGAVARILGSTGLSAADIALQGGGLANAKRAGTIAAGVQGGLEAVPVVGKAVKPISKVLAEKIVAAGKGISDAGATRAVKHAFGNTKKHWTSLGKNQVVPTGEAAIESGVVRFGESAGKTAKRADKVAKKSWGEVEKTFDEATNAGAAVEGKEIAQKILDDAAKIKAVPKNQQRINQLQDEALYYEKQGRMPLREAQSHKGEYDWKNVDPKHDLLGKNGNNLVNRAIARSIKGTVKGSGVKGADDFATNYRNFGSAATMKKAAEETALNFKKNRSPFSMTDYIAGGTGGVAAAAITGDAKDATMWGFITATANSLARKRGNSALAVSLYRLGQMIKKEPGKVRKYYDVLENAAKRGSDSLAVSHGLLLNHDPEYRRLITESENSENGPAH